jgi:RNA polymerase sigma-70 factor, ECF subfamily
MADEKQSMSTCAMPLTATDDAGQELERWQRTHDRSALERLMASSLDCAYTQARRTLGNDADAQDAVQEALIQIMRSAHRYDPARPFAPWLARHVHDACCRLRWRARRAHARERAVARPDATAVDEGVDAEAVRAAVAGLPERDRTAIELHYWAELPQAEVARELGVSENALAVRLHRARERLRGLLAQRGVAVGAAALAAALLPAQAWSAPPALVAGANGLGAVAQLPATSIPLGALRTVAWHAVRHPGWSIAAAALALGGTCVLTGMLLGGGREPAPPPRAEVPPPAVVPADGPWSGSAAEVLRWLEPDAGVRIAADLTTLRRSMAAVRPVSLLYDPQAAPALQRLRQCMAGADAEMRMVGIVAEAALGSGDGLALSFSYARRFLGALGMAQPEAGGLATRLMEPVLGNPVVQADPSGGGPGWRITKAKDHALWLGTEGRFLAFGPADAVPVRAAAAQVERPDLPAAAWLRADFRPLVAAYATEDADGSDPLDVAGFLGAHWHDLAPGLDIELGSVDGSLSSTMRMHGAVPTSPLNFSALTVSLNTGRLLPILPAENLRLADPARISPEPVGALLWATTGLRREAIAVLAADPKGLLSALPGAAALTPALSGDLTLIAEPGAPLPVISVVLGLSRPLDPAALTALLAPAGLSAASPGAGISAMWQGFTPLGMVQVLLTPDRLIATTAMDPAHALARAVAPPEAPLVVHADLPRMMATYGPLLLAQLRLPLATEAVLDASCLPPAVVLARHLAPYRLVWTPTADGAVIRERGLPLVAAWFTIASYSLVSESDPVSETRQMRTQRDRIQACARHQAAIAAAQAAAELLAAGGPFTAADRQALRVLVGGRELSEAELAGLGTRYWVGEHNEQELQRFGMSFDYDHLTAKPTPDGRLAVMLLREAGPGSSSVSMGILAWAIPLGDGWNLGVADGHAGLFTGPLPPSNTPPAQPQGNF